MCVLLQHGREQQPTAKPPTWGWMSPADGKTADFWMVESGRRQSHRLGKGIVAALGTIIAALNIQIGVPIENSPHPPHNGSMQPHTPPTTPTQHRPDPPRTLPKHPHNDGQASPMLRTVGGHNNCPTTAQHVHRTSAPQVRDPLD